MKNSKIIIYAVYHTIRIISNIYLFAITTYVLNRTENAPYVYQDVLKIVVHQKVLFNLRINKKECEETRCIFSHQIAAYLVKHMRCRDANNFIRTKDDFVLSHFLSGKFHNDTSNSYSVQHNSLYIFNYLRYFD